VKNTEGLPLRAASETRCQSAWGGCAAARRSCAFGVASEARVDQGRAGRLGAQVQRVLASGGLDLEQADLAATFPYRLDRVQRMAIQAFLGGASVVVCAPTGAGKTAIAEAAALAVLARRARAQRLTATLGFDQARGVGNPAGSAAGVALAMARRRGSALVARSSRRSSGTRVCLRAHAAPQAGGAPVAMCAAAAGAIAGGSYPSGRRPAAACAGGAQGPARGVHDAAQGAEQPEAVRAARALRRRPRRPADGRCVGRD